MYFCCVVGSVVKGNIETVRQGRAIVSVLTAKPDAAKMEEVFGCYDEKVEVSRKNALED